MSTTFTAQEANREYPDAEDTNEPQTDTERIRDVCSWIQDIIDNVNLPYISKEYMAHQLKYIQRTLLDINDSLTEKAQDER